MNKVTVTTKSETYQHEKNQTQTLSDEICERARLAKDVRFDGLFFTAVRSTGIYCRPVCPAPVPKRSNVSYFANAAAATAAGYRPCLRCRPELSPQARRADGDTTINRALEIIYDGYLQQKPVQTLAAQLNISTRQLQRIFVSHIGATPHAVHSTQRLLLAKQLLSESALPITDVALAAGFNSLRRFNAAFLQHCGIPPSQIRRLHAQVTNYSSDKQNSSTDIQLRLTYRPPLDFSCALQFLAKRAIPGIEQVNNDAYRRIFPIGDRITQAEVRASDQRSELILSLHNCEPRTIPDIVRRVRRMFDLDADLQAVYAVLDRDRRLKKAIAQRPGLRMICGWDGFETAVRAVLGQQVSVAGATTLTRRLVENCGELIQIDDATSDKSASLRLFPSAKRLRDAPLENIGLPRTRVATLRGLAAAVVDGDVTFDAGQRLEDFIRRCTALPGIGLWTANYIAMRALAMPDAYPASDLILRQRLGSPDTPVSERVSEQQSQAWRPWRGYAVFHLWHIDN